MVRRAIYLCDPCLDLGDEVVATHRYTANDGDTYEICGKCKELVEGSDLRVWKI